MGVMKKVKGATQLTRAAAAEKKIRETVGVVIDRPYVAAPVCTR